jgi:anti-sigma-K factor RskA
MPPDSKADLAHPEAADWVLGTLGPAQTEDFRRHLTDCPHCRAAVAEFGELGQMLQHLPPAAEPPPELEARTIASVLAAAANYPTSTDDRPSDSEDQPATRIQPRPQIPPLGPDDARIQPRPQIPPPAPDETRIQPRPQIPPPAPDDTRAEVIRLPVWRRHQGRLAVVVAAAAAIITAAIVIPLGLGGGGITVVTPLHATAAAKLIGDGAATGKATSREVGPSWTFNMTVHGLKVLPGNEVYECWYATSGSTRLHPQLVSGGTFIVDNSGSATVTMTTGVDPRQFRIMEVTAENPGTGALSGAVLLTGQTL